MKRVFALLFCLSLLVSTVLADPLPLLEDYAEDIVEPYDEEDPSMGVFSYSYRFPHADEEAEGGAGINEFYEYRIYNELEFLIQMAKDSFEGSDSSTAVTYMVTCNNDDYFSVLIRTEENNPDVSRVYWSANVFMRKIGNSDHTATLPQYLGILEASENDIWLQDRQTARADKLVREMVWEQIEENGAGIAYNEDFTEEELSHVFFPEEDFYLDETGNPVFFLQPGIAAPEEAGLLTFPLLLEDIQDEL